MASALNIGNIGWDREDPLSMPDIHGPLGRTLLRFVIPGGESETFRFNSLKSRQACEGPQHFINQGFSSE